MIAESFIKSLADRLSYLMDGLDFGSKKLNF